MTACPCGSSRPFSDCCEPIITGVRPAVTAEELMRARYSAYATVATDFIFETTHPGFRGDYDHKGTKEWAESSEWLGLEIVETRNGTPADMTGEVEFIARYREKGVLREHHEIALFQREEPGWLFTDARLVPAKPLVSTKVGRNEPCTCGSGLKYKKCCGK